MEPKILRTLNYGMYAIGVKGDERPSACIVNTVFQVTADPQTVAVSINVDNYTNEMIKKTGIFSVSVLSENTSGAVIGALGYTSGRDSDKLKNVSHKILREGVPVLRENVCCWFLCKVVTKAEVGTHTVFVGEIIAGSDEYTGTPMTYKYYHEVIKGRAPANAPTFLIEKKDQSRLAESSICSICGYVYSDKNVPFQELPDDWECPICGATKDAFIAR